MPFVETGYQVFSGAVQLDAIRDLDIVTGTLEENVFRDDQGKVKQVQHLETRLEFRKIGEAAMSATGVEGTIINMQMFIKLPGAKATVPHQDGAYFVTLGGSCDHRTIWMPLQEVTEENSCLAYIPGSHKWGLVEHRESGSTVRTRTGVTGRSIEVLDQQNHDFVDRFVAVPMASGDVIVHHPMTVHRSSANPTAVTRLALTCIVAL